MIHILYISAYVVDSEFVIWKISVKLHPKRKTKYKPVAPIGSNTKSKDYGKESPIQKVV